MTSDVTIIKTHSSESRGQEEAASGDHSCDKGHPMIIINPIC